MITLDPRPIGACSCPPAISGIPAIGTVVLEPPTQMLPVTDPDYYLQNLPRDDGVTRPDAAGNCPPDFKPHEIWGGEWVCTSTKPVVVYGGDDGFTPMTADEIAQAAYIERTQLMPEMPGGMSAYETPPAGVIDYTPAPVPKLSTAKVVGGVAVALLIIAALSRRK